MCGIVGYSGTKPFNLDTVKILLLINGYSRGMDSTGTYCERDGIVKDKLDIHDYLQLYGLTPSNLFIGHTRSKTVGAVSARAAHPFKYKNIVLVHNGTLTNHHLIFTKLGMPGSSWEVDSECIAAKLAADQNPMVLSQIKGAAAVVFTDVNNPEIMYVFRNRERPLSYVQCTEGDNKWMYISSEAGSLEVAGFKEDAIKSFETDILYTIKNGEIINQLQILNFPLSYEYPETKSQSNYIYPTDKHKEGKYCLCDEDTHGYHNQNYTLVKGQRYFVKTIKDTTQMWAIVDGKTVLVPISSFSYSYADMREPIKGTPAKCITDLVLYEGTPNERNCAKDGDDIEITAILESSSKYHYEGLNKRTREVILLRRDWLEFKFEKENVNGVKIN